MLAWSALAIPDSAVKPTEWALVKVDQGNAAAIGPHVISILAVGSDARPGEDMIHTRGDALQLVTINTQTHAASIIGVPRDSWVDIPGHGMDKINASLYYGGPQLLGQTVGNLIGVQPKYVFVTRFQYFEQLVHSIGGVYIRNPFAFSDTYAQAEGVPGRTHPPEWVRRHGLLPDPALAAHRRLRALGPPGDRAQGDPGQGARERRQPRRSSSGACSTRWATSTPTCPPAELFQLAQVMAQVDPSKVRSCVVQGGIGTSSGGASIVLPYVSQAQRHGQPDPRRRDPVPLRLTGP